MISQSTGSYETLIEALNDGATIVTANNRLAAYIHQLHAEKNLEAGEKAWVSADTLPWTLWLQRLWDQACVTGAVSQPPLLLTPEQERYLWERIIRQSVVGDSLRHVAGTVRHAQEAWGLVRAWRLPFSREEFSYNDNSAVFCNWAANYEQLCNERDWLSPADLVSALESSISGGSFRLSGRLLLCGFDELNPQQQQLLETLSDNGTSVSAIDLSGERGRSVRVQFADPREELERMARWVRWQLEHHTGDRIGLIVPRLAEQREGVLRALDEVLCPSSQRPGNEDQPRPYNLSLGIPLSDYPIIKTALQLCSCVPPILDIKTLGQVIRSPFIAQAETESAARALLDLKLRETGESTVALKRVLNYVDEESAPHFCPQLALRLKGWVSVMDKVPEHQPLGYWAKHFSEILTAVGWAASERTLSSEEYQTIEAWHSLLKSFYALDTVATVVPRRSAVALLMQLAEERMFQPKTDPVSVQVLGMLEAAGMEFDHLWILGLHAGVWPVVSHPNPFIPLPLQRKAQMPHSSAEREMMIATRVTNRLLASARDTVVSSPEHDGDETLMVSPLVGKLPSVDAATVPAWLGSKWLDLVHHSGSLIALEDDPVPALEAGQMRWGSTIFKLQSACPFRAFAELRLGARALDQTQLGLSAGVRGSLTHKVLEKVWAELVSQQQLLGKTEAGLRKLVKHSVKQVITSYAAKYTQTFTPRFRTLETERLTRQVMDWLEIEKQRSPFRVIFREKDYEVTIGGLRLKVRVDRVDELSDGKLLVVDYKTGEVRFSQWSGERPDEPQLPLYALAVEGHVAGVVFAQLKSGCMNWLGLGEEPDLVPGAIDYQQWTQGGDFPSWHDLLESWRDTLERLGSEFCAGEAKVDPKEFPKTCRYCELQSLCRIGEQRLLSEQATVGDTACES